MRTDRVKLYCSPSMNDERSEGFEGEGRGAAALGGAGNCGISSVTISCGFGGPVYFKAGPPSNSGTALATGFG